MVQQIRVVAVVRCCDSMVLQSYGYAVLQLKNSVAVMRCCSLKISAAVMWCCGYAVLRLGLAPRQGSVS